MTQTATSAKGHGVMIVYQPTYGHDGTPPGVRIGLWIDGLVAAEPDTGSAARSKAAELTEDPYLKWETRP